MNMKEQRLIGKEKVFCLVISLIFISPVFFVQGETSIRFLYIFWAGVIGWAIGKQFSNYLLKGRREERKKFSLLLSNFAVGAYIFIYVILLIIIDFILLRNNLLLFLLKIILVTYFLLYGGLRSIQTKKGWIRGFPLSKRAALISGIAEVILAFILLFWRFLIN